MPGQSEPHVPPSGQGVDASAAPYFPPGPQRGRLILVAALCALAVLGGGIYAFVAPVDGDGQGPAPSDAAGTGQNHQPTTPPQASDPDLVASDDFTGTAPDPSRWGIYELTAPNGSSWSKSMVRVADGVLRVVGAGRNPTGQGNVSGGLCWCGAGGDRLYGRWQVRARFDAGSGYGPIIGLWPQSDTQHDGSITLASAHEPDRKTVRGFVVWDHDGRRMSDERTLTGDFTRWHTYTVEWRESFVTIHVDDTLLYDSTVGGSGAVLPRVPMHLYLQQVVGPQGEVPAPEPHTPDEVTMHVDWVRVYR